MKTLFVLLCSFILISCQTSFKCENGSKVKYKVIEKEFLKTQASKDTLFKYLENLYCIEMIQKSNTYNIEINFTPLQLNKKKEGLFYMEIRMVGAKIPLYRDHKRKEPLVVLIDNKFFMLSKNTMEINEKIFVQLEKLFGDEKMEKYKQEIREGYIYLSQ